MSDDSGSQSNDAGSGDLAGVKRAAFNFYTLAALAFGSVIGTGGSLALYPSDDFAQLERDIKQTREELIYLRSEIRRLNEKVDSLPPEWLRRETEQLRRIVDKHEERIDRLESHK